MDVKDPENAQPQAEAQSPESMAAETTMAVNETAENAGTVSNEATVNGQDPEAEAEFMATEAIEDEEAAKAAETEAVKAPLPETLPEVIAMADALYERDAADITRDDINRVRGLFAMLRKSLVDAKRAEFEAANGTAEGFTEPEFAEDEQFKTIIAKIRYKKTEHQARVDAQKAENLAQKNAIIDEISALADDTDNVNRTFDRYKELQDKFKAIGEVPATDETAVWKRFQEARERYSDSLKVNKELRDYDFKKNLEQKELIILDAQKLDSEKDVVTAFKRVQELQVKWREVGPVAKDLRDDVWARFKDACQNVYKRYQAFFEERKAREAHNEAGKTAICERVEAYDFASLKTFADWDNMTKKLKEAQEEWKTFGFASRKMNNALFNRFRATCDTFFVLKATFFKNIKDELAQNLARKTKLAEQAEELSTSTDWKKTTDALVQLQKDWKTIGAVSKKHSDAVWSRFQKACDAFFAAKKAATSGVRQTEQANLQAKRDLIKELDKINEDTPKEEARALISDLQERWKLIGHVPFREKDKVYEQFRNRINEIRENYNISARRENMSRFEANVDGMGDDSNKLMRERERQARLLETRRAELRTYRNNLGFLNAKSKSGNSLVREFEQKIERLSDEIKQLEQKIKLLDSKM